MGDGAVITTRKNTIAILTTFQDFNPGYSLTGIVIDQAHMLARQGHMVMIYVEENFNDKFNKDSGLAAILERYHDRVVVRKKIKSMDLIDYEKDELSPQHQREASMCGEVFIDDFIKYGIDTVFTHDLVFIGWYLPHYHAVKYASNFLKDKANIFWYHWIHSVPIPQLRKDWWDLGSLGNNHYLSFPNKTEIMRVAEAWGTSLEKVKIIPHIKDIRTWYDFGEDSMSLIDKCPDIMQAQLIQIYPCSSDRLSAKQVEVVIRIFAHFKMTAKIPVFLVIANQWATGKQPKENISHYKNMAISLGLVEKEDFVFTSEIDTDWQNGISKKMLRELQLLSNVFIFPTREESFGLVGPEAVFSGSLPIINRSLKMMSEVLTIDALGFEFGSFQHELNVSEDKLNDYYKAICFAILRQISNMSPILVKNACRIKYNMESIYYRYYLPLVE